MAAIYFFHRDSRILVTAYWGRTSVEESDRISRARAHDPDRGSAVAHVIDLSDLEGSSASTRVEMDTFARLGVAYSAIYGSILPTAIVATRPHIFGEARMFEAAATDDPPDAPIRAVQSWEEAEVFIGVDLGPIREAIAERRRAFEGPTAPAT